MVVLFLQLVIKILIFFGLLNKFEIMIFSLCLVVVIPCFACRELKNPHLFFLLWKCSTSKTRNYTTFFLSPFRLTSVDSVLF